MSSARLLFWGARIACSLVVLFLVLSLVSHSHKQPGGQAAARAEEGRKFSRRGLLLPHQPIRAGLSDRHHNRNAAAVKRADTAVQEVTAQIDRRGVGRSAAYDPTNAVNAEATRDKAGESSQAGSSSIRAAIQRAVDAVRQVMREQREGGSAPPSNVAAGQQNAAGRGSATSSGGDINQYLAMCLAVKDQAADVREWVLHHEALGVGKVYVFDSSVSEQPLLKEIGDLVGQDLVEYTRLEKPRGQLWVYDECLKQHRSKHQFMGFLDADEFLVIKDPRYPDLPSVLRRYNGFGGLAVNWRLFGSSGYTKAPPGGAAANYWKCIPTHDLQSFQVKTLANLNHTLGAGLDPHHFVYKDGFATVNSRLDEVAGGHSEGFVEDTLVIFHYVTKSLEEFKAKVVRGSGMGNHRGMAFFHEIDDKSTDSCTDLMRAKQSQQLDVALEF